MRTLPIEATIALLRPVAHGVCRVVSRIGIDAPAQNLGRIDALLRRKLLRRYRLRKGRGRA
jgi:hypothetical protein